MATPGLPSCSNIDYNNLFYHHKIIYISFPYLPFKSSVSHYGCERLPWINLCHQTE